MVAVLSAKAESLTGTLVALTSIVENYNNISASFSSLQGIWSGIATKNTLLSAQNGGLTLLGEQLLGAGSLEAIDVLEAKNNQVRQSKTPHCDDGREPMVTPAVQNSSPQFVRMMLTVRSSPPFETQQLYTFNDTLQH